MATTAQTIEQTIEAAQAALNLDAQIAQTEQTVAANQKSYTSEAEELEALRAEKRDRETQEAMNAVALQVAQAAKAQVEASNEKLQKLMENTIANALASVGLNPGQSIEQTVKATLSSTRLGRKTPYDSVAPDGASAAVIRSRGEKATFGGFLRAITQRDIGTINDIYRAKGGKALGEGGGATSSGTGPSGGYLVPPEFNTELIEYLYPFSVMRNAGARSIKLTSPQYFQPRLAGTATATYEGENVAIPNYQQTFDQFSLSAKNLTALVPVSNFLLQDSDPGVDQIIKEDMAEVIGLKEDITFLYGVGSATVPQGILSRSDIQTIAATGANGDLITYGELVDVQTKLLTANIPLRNRVWVMNPVLLGTIRKIVDGYGRPIFADFDNPQVSTLNPAGMTGTRVGTLLGLPVFTSTQIASYSTGTGTTYDVALVEMSQVMIGDLGAIELASSTEGTYVDTVSGLTVSAFQSNQTLFRAIVRHDISLRHPAAVVVRKGLLP